MPWRAEDWEGLQPSRTASSSGAPPLAEEVARQILSRLPGRESMILGDFGGGLTAAHPDTATTFGRVATIDEHCPLTESFDVIAALGTVGPRSAAALDDLLRGMHDRLVEGGVLVATLPAASCVDGPAEIHLGRRAHARSPRFHEVDLQYRLQRAGFQGIRMRRVTGAGSVRPRLVAMAVRRAHN